MHPALFFEPDPVPRLPGPAVGPKGPKFGKKRTRRSYKLSLKHIGLNECGLGRRGFRTSGRKDDTNHGMPSARIAIWEPGTTHSTIYRCALGQVSFHEPPPWTVDPGPLLNQVTRGPGPAFEKPMGRWRLREPEVWVGTNVCPQQCIVIRRRDNTK